MSIPNKDIELIKSVSDHVSRAYPVPTYTTEDLAQEMFIYGMESYSKWDESQHTHKNESKRDKNLRLFLKNYMTLRIKNMKRALNKNKRAVNVNIVSFDQNDPVYENLLIDNTPKELDESDFDNLGLTEGEIKVLLYIGNNGLLGKNEPKKRDMVDDLGFGWKEVTNIINNLRENRELKNLLEGT